MKRRKETSKKVIEFMKNNKKIVISLVVIITFLTFFLTINYGRYVKDIIQVYYLRTKNFYFNSDKLTIHGKEYEIYPWDGKKELPLTIQMNSLLNSLKGTTSDILYDVSCETDDRISCYIDNQGITQMQRKIKSSEKVSTTSHKDSFNVYINAKNDVTLKDGDRIEVKVTAKSTYPYEEELSATFILIIGDYGINYVIEDNPGDIYFDDIITNTLTEKAMITLEIKDSSKATVDMSSVVFNLKDTTYEVDDNKFIKKIVFYIEPKSSLMVRFYKKDSKDNFSHISSDGESEIIKFNSDVVK